MLAFPDTGQPVRPMGKYYDVVIVGGGVTGSATAFFLARGGFDGTVAVIERDPSYTDVPSVRATGGIRQQFSTPENILIGLFGAEFVKSIGESLSVDGEAPTVDFKERGYLILASPQSLPVMQLNHAVQLELGARIEYQSNEMLRARCPWLEVRELAGGFFGLENEGWLDPYSLLHAFRRKAVSLGVTYVADEVKTLERVGARVAALGLAGGDRIEAGVVVNAAGARDAAELAAQVGVHLPVEPRKRCAFVFECRESIGETPQMILPNGVAFRGESGRYLTVVSPPPEQDAATKAYDIDYSLFDDIIWPTLARYVPAFEAIKLSSAYSCHYDVNTLDENVILGPVPGIANFLVAAGFSGHGLMQSPAVGRALAELIAHGEYRTLDLSRFGYERVIRNEPLIESNCY